MVENGDILINFFLFIESRNFYTRKVVVRRMSGFPDIKHLKSLAVTITAKILE